MAIDDFQFVFKEIVIRVKQTYPFVLGMLQGSIKGIGLPQIFLLDELEIFSNNMAQLTDRIVR